MRKLACTSVLAVVVTTPVLLSGCNPETSFTPVSNRPEHDHGSDGHAGHDHSHQHSDTGPHGGRLIDLGHNHKYHAELVQNNATETVTLYVLNTNMRELAISELAIFVNLTTGGKTTAYEMLAAGDRLSTNHSRFESTDKQLFQALETPGDITGKVRVRIQGVAYVGRIAYHDPSHEGSKQHH